MQYFTVYVTSQTREQAVKIGKILLDRRLVACVNIIPGMQSIYRWEGAVIEDTECVLIAKTKENLVNSVIRAVKENHSYECPCVVAWPISNGNPDYLRWIGESTLQQSCSQQDS
ncbi:MAG: divalent-cation tolerance protein CutA [Fibrobacterota bacterium]